MHLLVMRRAKRAGRGESGEGRYGSLGVRDSYAALNTRSCLICIAGSRDGFVSIRGVDARSYYHISLDK